MLKGLIIGSRVEGSERHEMPPHKILLQNHRANAVEPEVDTKHCNITTDQSIQRTLHSTQGTFVNMLDGLTIGSSLGGT